jgi:hypothetical protein
LLQGYRAVQTSGETNSCLFEAASLAVWGRRRPWFLRLATVLTGLPEVAAYAAEVTDLMLYFLEHRNYSREIFVETCELELLQLK